MKSFKNKAEEVRGDLSAHFPHLNFSVEAVKNPPQKLAACVDEIDTFLEGGIPFGGVTEFGMPLGREGRVLMLKYLINATCGIRIKPVWTLWISCHENFQVFPPAWFSRGVSPEKIVFTNSRKPLQDLKRAIINPLFKLIVLDSPPRFSKEDCFFLSRQARENHQLIMLLRHFFLTNRQGNIWANLRMNCWKKHASGEFIIKVIRGLSDRQLSIKEEVLK